MNKYSNNTIYFLLFLSFSNSLMFIMLLNTFFASTSISLALGFVWASIISVIINIIHKSIKKENSNSN